MQEKHFQSLVNGINLKNNPRRLFSAKETLNQEPFPDFDLEINKEDKDNDLDNPKIRRNRDDEEKKEDDRINTPPSK